MPARADTFDRADNPATIGAPSDGGAAWVSLAGAQTAGILSNEAYFPSGGALVGYATECGTADGETAIVIGSAPHGSGVQIRATDSNNRIYAFYDDFDKSVYIQKYVAGVFAPVTNRSVILVAGDVLSCVHTGSSLQLKKNGVNLGAALTESDLATVTKHGFTGNSPKIASWSFTPAIVAGPATKLGIRSHALGSANGAAASNVPFDFQPVILIQDASGNTVTTDNTTVVTATKFSGAGTLIGTVTKVATNGVCDFGAFTGVGHQDYATHSNQLGINGTGAHVIRYTSSPVLTTVDNAVISPVAKVVDGIAELPRSTPTRTALTIDGSTYLETAATLQARINTVQAGGGNLHHRIRVRDGENVTAQITVPQRAGGGTGYIQLESETLPCISGVTARPDFFTTQATWNSLSDNAILSINPSGLANVRLVGLNIRIAPTNLSPIVYFLVRFGDAEVNDTLAKVPIGFKMERCWLHGKPGTGQLSRALDLHAQDAAVFNNWFQDIACYGGQESQCILLGGGPGPTLIEDNYLEAAGENIMTGGFGVLVPQMVTADLTVRRNHINCPRTFQTSTAQHKNLFETKVGQRVLLEGNVLENSFSPHQDGTAILINGFGRVTVPWSGTHDVTIRKNFIRSAEGAIWVAGGDGVAPSYFTARVTIRQNVAVNIGADTDSVRVGDQSAKHLIATVTRITASHNTMLTGINTKMALYMVGGPGSAASLLYQDNLVSATRGIVADGITPGAASLNSAAPGATCDHNGFIDFAFGDASVQAGLAASGYAPNVFIGNISGVGFANPAITATWASADPDAICAALTLASGSMRAGQANQASDATDVGADMTAVRLAILGVWNSIASVQRARRRYGAPRTGTRTARQ